MEIRKKRKNRGGEEAGEHGGYRKEIAKGSCEKQRENKRKY